jgi:uncharacterized membrane protein
MTLRRITLFFLNLAVLGYIYGILALGLSLPVKLSIAPLITLSAFVFAILHSGQREGWKKTIILGIIVFLTGLFFESLGVATGLVYGPYHYTNQLGPKFLGLVPFIIPIAWTFMMYPSMIIAQHIIPDISTGVKRGLAVAALSGVVMTAWDVVMDPMMVFGGNWVWEIEGACFGIPLQNFGGWWLTTFTAVGLYLLLSKKIPDKITNIPDRWVVYSYSVTGIAAVATALIVGLGGPALAGIFALVPWMVIGFIKTNKKIG